MRGRLIKLLVPVPYWLKRFIFSIWLRFTEAGKIADRGGRIVVGSWEEIIRCGELCHVMHAHRYWWAGQKIKKGSRILDLGCGSGYGSWYLAKIQNDVLGFDPDTKSIRWAKNHFSSGGLSLVYSTSLDGREKFDYIVCFEVLEHDPSVMETILEHLAPGGMLIISTANGGKDSVRRWLIEKKSIISNPDHVKEYGSQEFEDLLLSYFERAEVFGHCLVGVYTFEEYHAQQKKQCELSSFEMRPDDFKNSEVMVAICRK